MKDVERKRLIARGFTPHQARVLRLVISGYANKEIASEMKLSEHGVKFHLTRIYKKTKFKNRSRLISGLSRWGIRG